MSNKVTGDCISLVGVGYFVWSFHTIYKPLENYIKRTAEEALAYVYLIKIKTEGFSEG